jgi:hypothetical protein
MALAEYVNDSSILLNDPNFSFTSKNQLLRWINTGRDELVMRTGCIRRLITGQSAFGASAQPGFAIPGGMQPGAIPDAVDNQGAAGGAFSDAYSNAYAQAGGAASGATVTLNMQTIAGLERYPYVGFFNPVLQAQHAGCDRVIDTIALSVNWGGVNRPTLDWMPWDEFQAYCRAYAVLNTSFPSVWSVFGDGSLGELWMFPIPSQAGDIEADVFALPKPIYENDDFEAIPREFRKGVKFVAAKMAFMSSGRYAQAQEMEQAFASSLGIARVSVDRGKTKSYYPTFP